MATATINRFVLLQRDARKPIKKISGLRICRTEADVESAVKRQAQSPLWISSDDRFTDWFLKFATNNKTVSKVWCLIALKRPRPESVPGLQGVVQRLIGADKWLPWDEFWEVVTSPPQERQDVFLGGTTDPKTKTVALVRGNLEFLTVPISLFPPSPSGVTPDFSRLGFTDYGKTVCFGDYEVAADAILYELDSEFRRRLHQQRKAEDKSFGACLRRLRKQRQLNQSDFLGIAAKTVARIERNETDKPHGATLQALASRLSVSPDEIESF